MTRNIEITINGKAYPCRQTMGAMLRFKHLTGEEVSVLDRKDGPDLELMCAFLYCCTAAACNADGVEFDMDFERFSDSVTVDDMTSWTRSQQTEVSASNGDGGKKKK